MLRIAILAATTLVLGVLPLAAQEHDHGTRSSPEDSSFKALKERGGRAMLVDQDRAVHHFDELPDGGRIELQATDDDTAAIKGIREHFQEIEAAFRRGDFNIPMLVHNRVVPGTSVMSARKAEIRYLRRELPRGAELRLSTTDPTVVEAIHQFMTFQRGDHRAEGTH